MAKKMCEKKKSKQEEAFAFVCKKCGLGSDKKKKLCKPKATS